MTGLKDKINGLEEPDLIFLYELLATTREFELAIAKVNARKSLPENPHLCVGQEAVGIGACYGLRQTDCVIPSLRGRSVLIAKGVPLKTIMAGIYGKATGPSRGKHTAHHMGDLKLGVMATSLLIGSQIPLAIGAALAFKYQQRDDVSLCFFGDGASNRGDFHESLNIAAIMSLPVVFICENNYYAIDTHVKDAMKIPDIAIRAQSYGMPGLTVDGNDVLAVHQATRNAVELAREGGGPSLIECKTYRFRSHSERFRESRPESEVDSWKKRCPVAAFRLFLLEKGVLDEARDEELMSVVKQKVEEAIQFAENSPYPEPKEIFEGIYSNGAVKEGRLCMN